MKSIAKQRRDSRIRRHGRIRRRVTGSTERPRLCVYRSHVHIYGQIVDDIGGRTLLGASSLSPDVAGKLSKLPKVDASREVGKLIAERAKAKGIQQVCFDRGGYLYHGRVRAFADGAREGGLEF